MNDVLRNQFLDTHNFRRSQLAKGLVAKNNGNFLPKAANMMKLENYCYLEEGAIEYARTCPDDVSDESERDDGIGELYHRVATSKVPTYRDAIKDAVTNWWKVVRLYPGIGMQATFRENHVDQPITSFTQMGWAQTSKLGCAIAECSADYVVICRYYPKGNNVGESVYKVGNPCSACTGSCDEDLGLCKDE